MFYVSILEQSEGRYGYFNLEYHEKAKEWVAFQFMAFGGN